MKMSKIHQVLGLPEDASEEELRRAYRNELRLVHPDRFSGDPGAYALANSHAALVTRAWTGRNEPPMEEDGGAREERRAGRAAGRAAGKGPLASLLERLRKAVPWAGSVSIQPRSSFTAGVEVTALDPRAWRVLDWTTTHGAVLVGRGLAGFSGEWPGGAAGGGGAGTVAGHVGASVVVGRRKRLEVVGEADLRLAGGVGLSGRVGSGGSKQAHVSVERGPVVGAVGVAAAAGGGLSLTHSVQVKVDDAMSVTMAGDLSSRASTLVFAPFEGVKISFKFQSVEGFPVIPPSVGLAFSLPPFSDLALWLSAKAFSAKLTTNPPGSLSGSLGWSVLPNRLALSSTLGIGMHSIGPVNLLLPGVEWGLGESVLLLVAGAAGLWGLHRGATWLAGAGPAGEDPGAEDHGHDAGEVEALRDEATGFARQMISSGRYAASVAASRVTVLAAFYGDPSSPTMARAVLSAEASGAVTALEPTSSDADTANVTVALQLAVRGDQLVIPRNNLERRIQGVYRPAGCRVHPTLTICYAANDQQDFEGGGDSGSGARRRRGRVVTVEAGGEDMVIQV